MKNVILTAFACGNSAPCGRWASELFSDPPAVGWVPGANSSQFEASGRAASNLEAWAASKARCSPGEVGRIAVVTFSAGWGFAYRLLLNSAASERLDALIVLDGIHTHDLSGFKRFAAAAASGSKLLVMAHSQITPPNFVPTRITNREIMSAATQANPGSCELAPDYVTSVELPAPITCGNQYGRETYRSDPLVEQDNSEGAWRLEYRGASAAVHIYIANHVQPRLWRMLADRWNSAA